MTDSFTLDYYDTAFENYIAYAKVEGRRIKLNFWDTSCLDNYANLRRCSYSNADVFIICYAVTERSSFESVESTVFKKSN